MVEAKDGRKQAHMDVLVAVFGTDASTAFAPNLKG